MECGACGTTNPAASKFCGECGARLTASEQHNERKIVSVLFADLVGFTSRSEQLDVEDVRGTLAGFHARLRQELESFGGTVEKFIGDAVMAVFGAPIAHEDDAERAVRAGLAIRNAISELGDDLHVRVGINTGEALVSVDVDPRTGEGMVAGDVVNTAARLQSAAPVDGVLVGEVTYRAAGGQVVFEAHAPIDAKGKADPVACWIAVEPRSFVPIVTRESVALVGRDRERLLLVDAFEHCRAERSVQLVTVVGVPGIGKTRLVAELGAYVESDADLTTWRHGNVLSYGSGVAFFALAQIVKQECGIFESDDAHVVGAKFDAAIAALGLEGADARWVRNQVGPLIGLGAEADGSRRSEAFAGWRFFFEAIGARSPTVIVLEDLHWADDALLDFVDGLVDRVSAVPLLVVATARPELLERRTGWAGGKINALTIGLGPLSTEHTGELIDQIMDRSLLPVDAEALLLERAGGNPLYALEYVRALVERGSATSLPETVQGIIAARLDGLTADEKSLLQDAAVIGAVSWLGALCALSGLDRDDADEMLRRLERKQLVRRARPSRIEGEIEIAFSHGLTRDVAYGQLPRATRAERHERAAVWFERLGRDNADAVALIADNYAEALSLRTTLGQETASLRIRCGRAHIDAARASAARYDHRAVARDTAGALALDLDPSERAELLVLAAVADYTAGVPDERALLEARSAAQDVGHVEDALRVGCLLIEWANHYAGDATQTAAYVEEALRLSTELPPGPIASLPAYYQAFRLSVSGHTDEAMRVADAEISRARAAGAESAVGLMLVWRGMARIETGDAEGGVTDIEQAVALLEEHGHPKATVTAYNLGLTLSALGRLDDAQRIYEQAVATAHRSGDAHNEGAATIELADIAYHAGRSSDAAAILAAVPSGDAWIEFDRSMVSGRLCLDEDPAQAATTAQAAQAFAARANNEDCLLAAHALRARAERAHGNTEATQEALRDFLDLWEEINGTMYLSRYLVEVGLVFAAFGRHSELASAIALLRTSTPWVEAATALADARYDDAATILGSIPSIPLRDAALHLATDIELTT